MTTISSRYFRDSPDFPSLSFMFSYTCNTIYSNIICPLRFYQDKFARIFLQLSCIYNILGCTCVWRGIESLLSSGVIGRLVPLFLSVYYHDYYDNKIVKIIRSTHVGVRLVLIKNSNLLWCRIMRYHYICMFINSIRIPNVMGTQYYIGRLTFWIGETDRLGTRYRILLTFNVRININELRRRRGFRPYSLQPVHVQGVLWMTFHQTSTDTRFKRN